jgi:UDP-2,3-diacylglucosamine pyrophosphatase LpxH
MQPEFDYLIVSDLHLRGGFNNPTERLYHFDEEFADFLRHYRLNRASERPWRLIIGGDFIEFLYITDLPDLKEPLLRGATFAESEYRYGAGTEAQKSRWKLDRILRSSHPQLLLALARFVAEGNEIIVLRGNHDIEMSWPEVQDHFRRLIAEHHPVDFSYLAMKEIVGERVQFPQWFWYSPGLLYVEHGCQYDPFCATQHMLYPFVPGATQHVQLSIAELSIRYFTNQMKVINAMAAENIMSVSEYVGWVVRGNLRLLPRIASLYGGMVRRVLAKAGRPQPEAERPVREEHERRVAAVDERFGLPPGTAAKVDAMHATPVMRRGIATARFLALDLIASGVLVIAAVVAILLWYPGRIGLLAVVGALALLGLVVYVGALRFRRISEAAQLRTTAERISVLFNVRYVVFGHSHAAGTWPLTDTTTYVNVGTWVPAGDDAYFVYFALSGDGDQRQGRLWRWLKREKRPEPY